MEGLSARSGETSRRSMKQRQNLEGVSATLTARGKATSSIQQGIGSLRNQAWMQPTVGHDRLG